MKIFVHHAGERLGPMSLEEAVAKAQAGELNPKDPAWVTGWPDWLTLADVPGFEEELSVMAAPDRVADAAMVDGAMYFYISPVRLALMSSITVGLFGIYWCYRNWRYLNIRHGLGIWPLVRAFFGIFFMHSLMHYIHADPIANRLAPARFSAFWLATGWIVLVLVSNFSTNWSGTLYETAGFGGVMLSYLFFVPVQRHINEVNEALADPPPYDRWTPMQIALLMFGIMSLLGLFWGIVMPDAVPAKV